MDIIGPDTLVFGVGDREGACQLVLDFGQLARERSHGGGVFAALGSTAMTIRHADHPCLPPPVAAAPNIREVVYGCLDQHPVDQIAAAIGWQSRYMPALAETSQTYLFEHAPKWSPRGGPRH